MAFVTTKGRFSYAHVLKPHSINGGVPAYSVDLLIPKTDTAGIQKIQAEITRVFNESTPTKFGGRRPANWRSPLMDGDTMMDKEGKPRTDTAGHMVLRAKCSQDQPPEVVDASKQPVFSARDFYSGCYGRISGGFFAYNNSGNMGISFGLNNVQKLEDGEALGGGKTSANDDFDDMPGYAQQYQPPAYPPYQAPDIYAPPTAPAYQQPAYQPPGYNSPLAPTYPQPANQPPGYASPGVAPPIYPQPAPQIDPLTGLPTNNQILGL